MASVPRSSSSAAARSYADVDGEGALDGAGKAGGCGFLKAKGRRASAVAGHGITAGEASMAEAVQTMAGSMKSKALSSTWS